MSATECVILDILMKCASLLVISIDAFDMWTCSNSFLFIMHYLCTIVSGIVNRSINLQYNTILCEFLR